MTKSEGSKKLRLPREREGVRRQSRACQRVEVSILYFISCGSNEEQLDHFKNALWENKIRKLFVFRIETLVINSNIPHSKMLGKL